MYRDGSNYKQHHSVILAGELSFTDLEPYLDEGEYFIPGQVGLKELQCLFPSFPTEDDHVWHELDENDVILTSNEPTVRLTSAKLLENFQKIAETGWLIEEAQERLGIE